MYSSVNSSCICGIDAHLIKIETDISNGLPVYNMVGLLSSEVKEAKERVRAALKNTGIEMPYNRIIVNLSPADLRKEGSAFDLGIAVSIIAAMGICRKDVLAECIFIGELSLNGEVKKVKGVLPIILKAKELGFKYCIIPFVNRKESFYVDGIEVLCVENLMEVIEFLNKENTIDEFGERIKNEKNEFEITDKYLEEKDYADVIGQEEVKRAILIAVAGKHNILLIGPPGTGKSMIASRIPSIMKRMSLEEKFEVTKIHSVCGLLDENGIVKERPFSSPHHNITMPALVGGGRYPVPGEITISHNGVLFLDELPEFNPSVIDALRQPMENKEISIVRNGAKQVFPAKCMIVAAMNPCRCGYYPDRNICNCSINDINNYLSRISGPFLDRIDMSINVPKVDIDVLTSTQSLSKENGVKKNMSSSEMREIVEKAAEFQKSRYGREKWNSEISTSEVKKYCIMDNETKEFLQNAYNHYNLSIRGYYKVLKVARTIADIEESENIKLNHVAEALGYRITNMLTIKRY